MYRKKSHIHFIGIGGIGMSGIATILKYQGYTISGCDLDLDQHNVKTLKTLGCTIYHGNNTPACNDESIDILVYSSAIKKEYPEIIQAQQRGIPTIPRALMLAELMRTKYSVAISGSHGKTTTTSLIAHILMEASIDPTVIIGGNLKALSSNARLGNGDFVIVEADESDRSFLHLDATLAIVTNIDLEHLETYKDLDDIKQTFVQFLNNIPFYGKAIVCIDDENIRSILPMPHIKIITYGIEHKADITATDIVLNSDHSLFTAWRKQEKLGTIHFAMPGKHNILNALGAISLALDIGTSFATIAQALKSFKGIDRRFSYCGQYKGAEIFDDYGHHPKEIENTLKVARNRATGKVIVLFQPHRYSRTHKLWHVFIDMFLRAEIDHLIVTDIYPASEAPIEHITSELFVRQIKDQNPSFYIEYVPYDARFDALKNALDSVITANDLVVLQGAGKINKLVSCLE